MTEKKRRGEKLGEALGTGLARRFARDLLARFPFRNLFREGMKRFSRARQRSAALEKSPFSALSAAWNIRPGQEKNFIRMRRAEFFCGTGLCCFAALGFLRQALFESSPLPIRLFSSAACHFGEREPEQREIVSRDSTHEGCPAPLLRERDAGQGEAQRRARRGRPALCPRVRRDKTG